MPLFFLLQDNSASITAARLITTLDPISIPILIPVTLTARVLVHLDSLLEEILMSQVGLLLDRLVAETETVAVMEPRPLTALTELTALVPGLTVA